MIRARWIVAWCVWGTLWVAQPASAQEPSEVATPQPSAAGFSPSYLEYRRAELAHLAKRSRVGLFSTAAATGVGIALVTPALVGQCVRVASSSSFDDLRCSSTGKVLLGVGMPILLAGVTGLLVTAIMYGVRRGKTRNIDQQLAYERHHSVRWEPSRRALAF